MTTDQATTIRRKWNQGGILQSCDHLNLELELNDLGDITGNYVCILCGQSVAHESVDYTEGMMTKSEAGVLRPKSTQQVDPPICPHCKLGLERTDDGRLTSAYHCLDCGEPYATKL
jgi:hypothetical protein